MTATIALRMHSFSIEANSMLKNNLSATQVAEIRNMQTEKKGESAG